ncbi:hypothetical protein DX130_12635 [Paenibacillus paeoniae]|uniref:AraC-type arabinose-binding/dimerisation domain-containing protein n=2 Tax=Paenibacillus paeoniae TaxID=2292705 RepID=A0A371PF23_9BACL|nr:hypothetical protein DX130_12635 [Paenibacillus paeoniae]
MLAADAMLFKLEEIRLLNKEEYIRLGKSILTLHTLLLVSGGSGVCGINGDSIKISRGTCLVLTPGVLLETSAEEIREVQIYLITFYVYDASEPFRIEQGELPCRQVVMVPSYSRLEELALHMVQHQQRSNTWDKLKANMWFQELLLDLLFGEIARLGQIGQSRRSFLFLLSFASCQTLLCIYVACGPYTVTEGKG